MSEDECPWLSQISRLLIEKSLLIDDLGLLNGKIGISIYFFQLYRKTANNQYKQVAEKLVEDVYDRIASSNRIIDFENGLAGIAWGIEYLVQFGFIEADTDEALSDLDDKIFQYLIDHQSLSLGLRNGILGYGFYCISRLKGEKVNQFTSRKYLLLRLLMHLVDQLYKIVEEKTEALREPITFSITWDLPWLLYFLSELHRLNIYNKKVQIILSQLELIVKSTYPIKDTHKLFLLLSIERLIQQTSAKNWGQHLKVLQLSINCDKIPYEFSDKNVTPIHGYAGFGSLLKLLSVNNHGHGKLSSILFNKINNSTLWQEIKEKKDFSSKDLGILQGLSGIAYSTLILSKTG